jgi:tetratricopeptide (TPR) repeat protein
MTADQWLNITQLPDWASWFTQSVVAEDTGNIPERLNKIEKIYDLISLLGNHVTVAAAVIGVLVAIMTVSTLGLAVISIYNDRRDAKVHMDLLAHSATTIKTANTLMNIAKETAAHSADAAMRLVIQDGKDTMTRCSELIKSVDEEDYEYRGLAATAEWQETVRVLGLDIISIERQFRLYQNMPDFSAIYGSARAENDLKIFDVGYLILGMYHHQQQNYSIAIESWKKGLDAPQMFPTDRYLSVRPRLLIWIAREYNNVGNYARALGALRDTRYPIGTALQGTPIGIAITALLFESEFFEINSKDPAASDPAALDDVIQRAITAMDARSTGTPRVATLLGNMLLVQEAEHGPPKVDGKEIKTAATYFERAQSSDMWALLGLAQYYDLYEAEGERDKYAERFLTQLRNTALQHREVHTGLTRRAAQTQCEIWTKKPTLAWQNEASVFSGLNERLRIYSPIRKRPVTLAEFIREVGEIHKQHGITRNIIKALKA